MFEDHRAPIAALAVSPDDATLASASWDGTVRLWPLRSGAKRVLEGHSQNVNGVAFTPDGKSVVSVGYDLTLRIWRLPDGAPDVIALPSPLNAVVIAADGEIATGGADGKVRFLSAGNKPAAEVQADPTPIVALTISPDGAVWSVAFLPDGATLLTGGADGVIRRWNAVTGAAVGSSLRGTPADPLAAYAGDHGAEIFRACVACHTLSEKDGPRAGPTLSGLFGRRIASLPGYRFSEALTKLNIVWTPETVGKLFELGPNAYTPGTKMPEQRISSPEDRKALTDFLARAGGR